MSEHQMQYNAGTGFLLIINILALSAISAMILRPTDSWFVFKTRNI